MLPVIRNSNKEFCILKRILLAGIIFADDALVNKG